MISVFAFAKILLLLYLQGLTSIFYKNNRAWIPFHNLLKRVSCMAACWTYSSNTNTHYSTFHLLHKQVPKTMLLLVTRLCGRKEAANNTSNLSESCRMTDNKRLGLKISMLQQVAKHILPTQTLIATPFTTCASRCLKHCCQELPACSGREKYC